MARSTPATDPTRARLIAGDPLRAIAALGVFGIHAVGEAVAVNNFGGLGAVPNVFVSLYGWPGWIFYGLNSFVGLFFVLSGYLLSRPFLASILDDQPFPSLSKYFRNRALRILPAFWAAFAIVLIVNGTRGADFLDVASLGTFISRWGSSPFHDVFGQAWSLNVEVRFYLLLPVCALVLMALSWGRFPRWSRFTVVFLALAVLSRASVYHVPHDAPYYQSIWTNGHYFLPGIALAAIERGVAAKLQNRRWLRPVALIVFAAGMIGLFGSLWIREHMAWPWEELVGDAGAAAVLGGALLYQWTGGGCWRVIDNSVLIWIGIRSYPLFLIHSVVLDELGSRLQVGDYKTTLLLLAPVALVVSLVAADLLHRFVEVPALALKRSRAPAPPAAPVREAVADVREAAAIEVEAQ
jgi:acetyltransferase